MTDEPMQLSHRTLNRAKDRILDSERNLIDKVVTAPAVPLSDDPDKVFAEQPMSREDRERNYRRFLADPRLAEALVDQEMARYNLKDRVPRSVVEYFKEAHREFGGP